MAIVRRKPRNSSLRFQTFLDSSDITKKKPEKALTVPKKRISGRNAYGRITVRHRGGGAKRKYRLIDFNRYYKDVRGTVKSIEYDPNRNVRIGLVSYENGAKAYTLMPKGLSVGGIVLASRHAEVAVGNSLPLSSIPIGFFVHNIELYPGSGGKIARSAGTAAQLAGKTEAHATLRMPSGEVRMVPVECWASVGELGNADFRNIVWGTAGRKRRLGYRSTVRGMAMNPVDHPHGGGEGRSKSGSHPVSFSGVGAKGTRTRRRKNPLIIRRRKSK